MKDRLPTYFSALNRTITKAQASEPDLVPMQMSQAYEWAVETAIRTHKDGKKVMFIGNGGSAGISSHLAVDYSKNWKIRSLAFNDAATLTCLANDYGYEHVFAKQIEWHGNEGDLLIAISSSGTSENIIRGVEAAKDKGCAILTCSGFDPDNKLRKMGEVNFYTPSSEYGFVEVAHFTLLHAIIDLAMGWNEEDGLWAKEKKAAQI